MFRKATQNSAYGGGDKGYIASAELAAFGESSDCDEFFDDTWCTKASMTTARRDAGGFSLAANGYCGGGNVGGVRSANFERYVPDGWVAAADMPAPARRFWGGATISGYGYAIGGGDAANNSLADNDNYQYDTWTADTDLPAPVRQGVLVGTANSKIYAVGGITPTLAGNCTQDNDEFAAGAWAAKTDHPNAFAIGQGVSLEVAGLMYTNQGLRTGGTVDGTHYIYDPSTDSWAVAPTTRGTAAAYLMGFSINNHTYLPGGRDNAGNPISNTDRYDPVLGTWSAMTNIIPPARFAAAGFNI